MDWLGYAALLLICPIAMMFMMRGMVHRGEDMRGGKDPLAGMREEQLRELTRRARDEIDQREAHSATRGGDPWPRQCPPNSTADAPFGGTEQPTPRSL